MSKEIIYYNSDQAAKPAKLTLSDGTVKDLWIASDGSGFKEEHMARYKGCTHNQCQCGTWKLKRYLNCESCREISTKSTYESKTPLEYREQPVCLYQSDIYFWTLEDIEDYCIENNVRKQDLQLMHCEPNTPREVDYEYFSDCIPEDSDGDVYSKEMIAAVELLNKIIREHKPISWSEGKFRVVFGKEVSDV